MNELLIKTTITILSKIFSTTSPLHDAAKQNIESARIELQHSNGDVMIIRSALQKMEIAANSLRKPMWNSENWFQDIHHLDMSQRQNYNDLITKIAAIHSMLGDDYSIVLHWADKAVNFPNENPLELSEILKPQDYESIISRIQVAWDTEDSTNEYITERSRYD